MIHLLDTDTFILLQRGSALVRPRTEKEKAVRNSAARILASCVKRHSAGDVIGLSAITLAELEFGLHFSGRFQEKQAVMRKLLAPFTAFDFDAFACVHHYGAIRARLESEGRGIGPLDTLTATHAMALGAILVTHNTKEFQRVEGLVVEDWS